MSLQQGEFYLLNERDCAILTNNDVFPPPSFEYPPPSLTLSSSIFFEDALANSAPRLEEFYLFLSNWERQLVDPILHPTGRRRGGHPSNSLKQTLQRYFDFITNISLPLRRDASGENLRRAHSKLMSIAKILGVTLPLDQQREARLERRRELQRLRRASQVNERRTLTAQNDRGIVHGAYEPVQQPNVTIETRSRSRPRRTIDLNSAAFSYDSSLDYACHRQLLIGELSRTCTHCSAKCFRDERAGLCCASGKVRVPIINPPPDLYLAYFTRDTQEHRHFMDNIRAYNSCFQMTSMGVTNRLDHGNFRSTFSCSGQVIHRIGSLFPGSNQASVYLQLYFTGASDTQVNNRCSIFSSVRPHIVRAFQDFLECNNHLIRSFKTTVQNMPADVSQLIIPVHAAAQPGVHPGCLNAPTTNETAAIIVNGEIADSRDIVIYSKDRPPHRINEFHQYYDALAYPLLFFYGQASWTYDMKQVNPANGALTAKNLSAMKYYSYLFMIRNDGDDFILKTGHLLNQFVVDMYAKVEAHRLFFIRTHQKELRASDYIHLRDAVMNDGVGSVQDARVILPSDFIGSPRHMHEYVQDAMAFVRIFGRPDLFVTMTCNPKWPEIAGRLGTGQQAHERHDLCARVFKQKIDKMMDLLNKHEVFGPTNSSMYSIEWQKRGLPHAHILLWLKTRLRPEQIDRVISAELPDKQTDPILFEIVSKHMIHGPCGSHDYNSPCMDPKTKKCSKKYPREFRDATQHDIDGYPTYARRSPESGGHSFLIEGKNFTVTNQWVVPYSPILSKIFNCHLNVESCHSVKSIKYICKYVHKGSDRLQFEARQSNDEIAEFLMGRYLSSNEAFWRLFSFQIHGREPAVMRLHVHLENGQRVYYRAEDIVHAAAAPPKTTLTAFFALCAADPSATRDLLYIDVPRFYTYNKRTGEFSKRIQRNQVGRIYTVHPRQGDCFYLRILLTKVPGPRSFQELKTVDGVVCATYREACERRGLLEADNHWGQTLDEAVIDRMPSAIRLIFAIIIANCMPSNPLNLWEKYKEALSEDLLSARRRIYCDQQIDFSPEIFNQTLILIEDLTLRMGGLLLKDLGMPSPDRAAIDMLNSEVVRETDYNRETLAAYVNEHLELLNDEQNAVISRLNLALDSNTGGYFFLDAPGGTGKTFIINLILAAHRAKGSIILAVASSGIAATLMAGGRTAHSAFNIPFELNSSDKPMCNLTRNTAKARMLQYCKAIIWDECTMSHKKAVETVDRSLQFIRDNDRPFGGIPVLFSGDFRQTLPVVPRSTPADQINACLKQSYLWPHINRLQLARNMRVHLNNEPDAVDFCRKLLLIGNGKYPENDLGLIQLDSGLCRPVANVDSLIDSVFPNLLNNLSSIDWLCERAILAPLNASVNEINHMIQDRLTNEQPRTYLSVDRTCDPDQAVNFPIEFLNSMCVSGLPPHELILKVGSPVMLIRNLEPPRLCNGTRLRVKQLRNFSIQATIMNGAYKGEDVDIPRIPLISSDLVVDFKRLQFPLRLAYAITINKSQGQSLKVAGIDLSTSCFSHGQLYVACSRVGMPSKLFILAPPRDQTNNIVYQQALI